MIQNRLIKGALPITARLLADDLGLQCHFGAQGFACLQSDDGVKHLYIPDLPLDDPLAGDMALGGILHEDGHFSVTDLLLMQSIQDGLLHSITNVLEDIRSERHQIGKYAGGGKILRKMIAAMVQRGKYPYDRETDGLLDWLFCYILGTLRSDLLGQSALQPMAQRAAEVLPDLLPGDAFSKLTTLMYSVVDKKSTREVMDLANEILTMLRDECREDDTEQQSSSSSEQDNDDEPQKENPSAEDQSSQDNQLDSGNGDQTEPDQEQSGSDAANPPDAPNDDDQSSQGNQEEEVGSSQESNADPDAEAGGDGHASSPESASESQDEPKGNSKASPGDDAQEAGDEGGKPETTNSQANANESSQDSSSGSNGDSDNQDAQGNQPGADGGEVPEQDQGNEVGGDADDGTEPTSGQSNGEAEGEVDKRKALAGLLNSDDNGDKPWDVAKVLSEAIGEIKKDASEGIVRLPEAIPMTLEAGNSEEIMGRVRAESVAVRRKTIGLLEAQARTKLLYGRSGSRIEPRRMWMSRTGNCRVFEKRIEGVKQNTSILLLADRSISMNTRISLAMDAALSVKLAMEQAPGIDTAVAAFPHSARGSHDNVLLVSDFNETARKTAQRFTAVGTEGSTPMAEALLWCGYHLHASLRDRKILVVLTDGRPDVDSSTRYMIKMLEESGVEVMAIGIRIDVSGLFALSGQIEDMKDLPSVLFGMLQQKLAKAA